MKKPLAFALLVLVPLAASAQVPVRGIGSPGGSAAGIAVTGRGAMRVPVKVVRFTAQARGPADDRSVLAALRSAGIDDPVIGPTGPYINVNSGSSTTVRGTVRDVSQAKLERLGFAAAEYLRAHPGTQLEAVQLSPHIEDCTQIEQTVRVAALADAHRKALAIAAASGVTLEAVVAVSENGGCPLESDQFNNQFNNGPPPALDLSTLTATIGIFESVTYAIAPADASRRRPL